MSHTDIAATTGSCGLTLTATYDALDRTNALVLRSICCESTWSTACNTMLVDGDVLLDPGVQAAPACAGDRWEWRVIPAQSSM
jgi:hypothetical protein